MLRSIDEIAQALAAFAKSSSAEQVSLRSVWALYRREHVKRLAAPEMADLSWQNLEQYFGDLSETDFNQAAVIE
ncbi:MAG TPA: hypothetical protein VGV07_18185 [Devosia sp.]|jgi:hypothetical protein|uniref:hypothetical protein n=1 Tax=Devosia sp. TaxID=1871048 RepID=UPI002DDDA782|nr:hypothetical protein [Devosia sp.]HEV2517188.1 hypothetical protein [Devosia sp.]